MNTTDIRRLILLVIFSFSALMLWQKWQEYEAAHAPKLPSSTVPRSSGLYRRDGTEGGFRRGGRDSHAHACDGNRVALGGPRRAHRPDGDCEDGSLRSGDQYARR
jgi:hypothetical protein